MSRFYQPPNNDVFANIEAEIDAGQPSRTRPGTAPGEKSYPKVKNNSSGKMVEDKPANAGFLAYQKWKEADDEKKKRRAAGEVLPEDLGEPWTWSRISLTLATFLAISMLLSNFVVGMPFWGFEKPVIKYAKSVFSPPNQIFTLPQLAVFNGADPNRPIFLSLDGDVYDVSASRRLYGPYGSYHFMAGRDASRAFVTGCFETHLTHDLRGISESEQAALANWKTFFASHDKYTKVGTLRLPPIDPDSPIPVDCNAPAGEKGGPRTGASTADAPEPVQAQAPAHAHHHHHHAQDSKPSDGMAAEPRPREEL